MPGRVPVVAGDGRCTGIIAQADIALETAEHQAAELVREVSRANGSHGSR